MVEEKTYKSQSTLELLLGKVVEKQEFSKCVLTIYDSDILHFQMKDKETLSANDVIESRDWLNSFGDVKFLVLTEGGYRTEVEDDFRKESASEVGSAHTIADAIVVKSLSQRIIANLYIKFNKPVRPTRVFSDAESAAFWLMSFR